MFIRKNLGATYYGSCDGVAPGSFMWDARGCAARAAPAPTPAPVQTQAPTPAPTPAPAPGMYVRPPPPAPVIVTVDNAASFRAQQEYDERMRAQMAETEAQRAKSVAEAATAKAQREADILRAQSNAGMVDWEGGAATYASSGGSSKTDLPTSSKSSMYLIAGLFVAVGLIAASKKK